VPTSLPWRWVQEEQWKTITMPAMRMEDFTPFMQAEDKAAHIREHNPHMALDMPA
jgi:hypothetical protein